MVSTSAYELPKEMTLTVTALQAGFLNAWVDFNGAGDRADAQEQMFDSGPLAERADSLSVSVPEGTFVEGSTFARFGFSSAGTLFRDGLPDDGEVEDYRVAVLRLVLGNATRDNVPNVINVTFIAPYTVGLRELDANQLVCADTNDDGKVNIIGAMHVAQYTVDPTGSGGVLYKPLWEAASDPLTDPPT